MQTFFPFESPRKCAEVLDNKRLFSQVREAYIIIKQSKGWKNHPALIMWKDHIEALIHYYNVMLISCILRGYKIKKYKLLIYNTDNVEEKDPEAVPLHIALASEEELFRNCKKPKWFGNKKFHISHQSNLLRKNYEHYKTFFNTKSDIEYWWPTHHIDEW